MRNRYATKLLFSASNIEGGAAGVRRLAREQPEDGGCDLGRIAAALHRHEVFEPFDAIRLAAARVNRGVNETRAHRVDANALSGDFARESDGKRVDGAL